jgi:hypothetical protein
LPTRRHEVDRAKERQSRDGDAKMSNQRRELSRDVRKPLALSTLALTSNPRSAPRSPTRFPTARRRRRRPWP